MTMKSGLKQAAVKGGKAAVTKGVRMKAVKVIDPRICWGAFNTNEFKTDDKGIKQRTLRRSRRLFDRRSKPGYSRPNYNV